MRSAILLLVLACHCCSLGAQTDAFSTTIEKVKSSIVPVACATWPDTKMESSVKEIEGTGFFVSYEGDFVTAAHVIKDHFAWNRKGEPEADCFPIIYLPASAWQSPGRKWFAFGPCAMDSDIDVAVCKTALNPFMDSGLHINRLRLASLVPPDGTAVAFTGFPQHILLPITSRANIAATGAFLAAGQMDIVVDKTVWHGVSGGPLYLADGTVIGIVIKMGEELWSGLGFARQTSAILKFLVANHVRVWEPEPEQTKQKNKK
ncbi:MAG: S1 family peptidase [Terriglobales bacterium]